MGTTNTLDVTTAQTLSALLDTSRQGTLLSVKVHKIGEVHGAGAAKIVYGDAWVHTLLWAGFPYRSLVERSDKLLGEWLGSGFFIKELAQEARNQRPEVALSEVCHATQEVQSWFYRVLHGEPAEQANPSVWEPLVVNGKPVPGCRVYVGCARPAEPRSPQPGCVYIQGVKLGESILTPAPHGEWHADSRCKTIVKQLLKDKLPVGRYCQYRLEPERMVDLCIGATAAAAAKAAKISIDPESLRMLF